jgi:hypothetical protein
MAYDLVSNNFKNFGITNYCWRYILENAFALGWKPMGTELYEYDEEIDIDDDVLREDWYGDLYSERYSDSDERYWDEGYHGYAGQRMYYKDVENLISVIIKAILRGELIDDEEEDEENEDPYFDDELLGTGTFCSDFFYFFMEFYRYNIEIEEEEGQEYDGKGGFFLIT